MSFAVVNSNDYFTREGFLWQLRCPAAFFRNNEGLSGVQKDTSYTRESETMTPAKARKIIRRGLLLLPSVLASIAFLFSPEVAGITRNVISKRNTMMGKYRVNPPIHWVTGYGGDSSLALITAPGIGRIGFQRYWRDEVPVSEMGFYPISHPELQLTKNVPLDDVTILEKRSLVLGHESLTCWDLIHHNKYVGDRPGDPAIADIRCSTNTDDFYAYFTGWRGDSNAFYETLRGIRVVE